MVSWKWHDYPNLEIRCNSTLRLGLVVHDMLANVLACPKDCLANLSKGCQFLFEQVSASQNIGQPNFGCKVQTKHANLLLFTLTLKQRYCAPDGVIFIMWWLPHDLSLHFVLCTYKLFVELVCGIAQHLKLKRWTYLFVASTQKRCYSQKTHTQRHVNFQWCIPCDTHRPDTLK